MEGKGKGGVKFGNTNNNKNRNTSNIKHAITDKSNLTDADTVVPVKGGFTLIINPEYHSTSFTNLIRYIKQQCMSNGSKIIRKPTLFNYILRLRKECNDKYNGSTCLLLDLLEIYPDNTFKNGLINNSRGFPDLEKIRSVFINNRFFLSNAIRYFLRPGDIIIFNNVTEKKGISINKTEDDEGRVINNTPLDIIYYTWSTYIPQNDDKFFKPIIDRWESQVNDYEERLDKEFPIQFINDIKDLKDIKEVKSKKSPSPEQEVMSQEISDE